MPEFFKAASFLRFGSAWSLGFRALLVGSSPGPNRNRIPWRIAHGAIPGPCVQSESPEQSCRFGHLLGSEASILKVPGPGSQSCPRVPPSLQYLMKKDLKKCLPYDFFCILRFCMMLPLVLSSAVKLSESETKVTDLTGTNGTTSKESPCCKRNVNRMPEFLKKKSVGEGEKRHGVNESRRMTSHVQRHALISMSLSAETKRIFSGFRSSSVHVFKTLYTIMNVFNVRILRACCILMWFNTCHWILVSQFSSEGAYLCLPS